MNDDIDSLRNDALRQRAKEAPEVPRITDEEAAVLALVMLPSYPSRPSLVDRGLLEKDLPTDPFAITAIGRAALAKHRSDREREIRRKAIEECVATLQRLAKRMDAKGRRAACNQTLLAIGAIQMEVQP